MKLRKGFLLGCLAASSALADKPVPLGTREALIERREAVKQREILCGEGPYEGMYSHHDSECWQGDMTMFAGLSCLAATLAGDEDTASARCRDVAAAQAPDGKWNRGPMFVGVDYPDGDFSRDQSRGVAAYLTAKGWVSQDPEDQAEARAAGLLWQDYLYSHDNKMCPEEQGKCYFRPGNTNLFYNTFRLIDILPPRGTPNELVEDMYKSEWYLNWGFTAEVKYLLWTETDLREKFYPSHIKASSIITYRALNQEPDGSVRNRRIARKLGQAARSLHRRDLDNPLYDFLRNGNRPSLVTKVLDRCGPEETEGIYWPARDTRVFDWAWQRHSSEKAWEREDGHSCVFLLNLMIARLDGKFNW